VIEKQTSVIRSYRIGVYLCGIGRKFKVPQSTEEQSVFENRKALVKLYWFSSLRFYQACCKR